MKITTSRQVIELVGAFALLNSAVEEGTPIEEIHKLVAPEALLIAAGRLAEADNLPEEFMVQTLKLAANIVSAYKED